MSAPWTPPGPVTIPGAEPVLYVLTEQAEEFLELVDLINSAEPDLQNWEVAAIYGRGFRAGATRGVFMSVLVFAVGLAGMLSWNGLFA